jgi:Caspase domain
MSLVFDAALPPTSAQTHALVIGIDDYPHLLGGSKSQQQPAVNSFGLPQLTSPRVSASAFVNWLPSLGNRKAPLGTVDLLLSPGIHIDIAARRVAVDLPTMANIKAAYKAWVAKTTANSKNIAVFYYCGHGLEKEGTTILLPSDFGDPSEANISERMIDFSLTYDCTLLETSAGTQMFLIDACRETPLQLLALRTSPTALISTTKLQQQPRDAPIFQSANSGLQAHGQPGQISFFTDALIACLSKFGARGKNNNKWEISTSSLGQAMKWYMRRLKPVGLPPLVCDVGAGKSNFDSVIHSFLGQAYVMSSVDCDPDAALAHAEITINDGGAALHSRNNPQPEPFEFDVPAGQYDVQVHFPAQNFTDKNCAQLMQPPFTPCTVEV